MLRVEEVSRVLMVSDRAVRKWLENGKLYGSYKLSMRNTNWWEVGEKDLLYFIQSNNKYRTREPAYLQYLEQVGKIDKLERKSWRN